MPDPHATLTKLTAELFEISTLGSIGAVLGWDENVMLPSNGTDHRARQASMIARLTHERFTAPQIGDWLSELEASDLVKVSDSDAATIIRETRRDYDRSTKLPTSLVEELSSTTVKSQAAWTKAKMSSDFPTFAPWLQKMMDLKKQEASCIGYTTGNPYDALLDAYEPGETAASLITLFETFRPKLVELIARIKNSSRVAPLEILERTYPPALQEQFAREGAKALGFDFESGRLDISVHPFCSGMAPGDTRITTRYDEKFFGDAFLGTLHETGHALYEQGLPKDKHFGTPLADAVSLGIHESQSRTWENIVGRSRSFWTHFLPRARQIFPIAIGDVSLDDWMFAVNDIRPSYIRTEADEATYNLHIMLRFEMEQLLIKNEIKIDEVPSVWNDRTNKYLGITPPDDARGCLQDVHWSCGLFGYFPTYTLGNLYAAQLFEQARKDLGDVDAQFARGEFKPLLDWLRKNIHQHGKRYTGRQLVKRITGQDLTADALMRHLNEKAAVYYKV